MRKYYHTDTKHADRNRRKEKEGESEREGATRDARTRGAYREPYTAETKPRPALNSGLRPATPKHE